VVRLLEWEKGGKRPLGEVISVLDAEIPNDAAMKENIARRRLSFAIS
jgi:ribonuclease R